MGKEDQEHEKVIHMEFDTDDEHVRATKVC